MLADLVRPARLCVLAGEWWRQANLLQPMKRFEFWKKAAVPLMRP
jgi:hypothetical protein